jgi:hypothetical protein
MSQQQDDQRIQALRQAIHELESSLPAHSIPPSMLIRLEELEDELARIQKQADSSRAQN